MDKSTLPINGVIANGLRETAGTCWPILAELLIYAPIFLSISLAGILLTGYFYEALMANQSVTNVIPSLPLPNRPYLLISFIIPSIILGPIMAGVIMAAIKKQRGEIISAKTTFSCYHKLIPISIHLITLQTLSTIVIPSPINLIGFNLSAGYFMLFSPIMFVTNILTSQTMPLMCEKNLNALESMKTSCSMMLAKWNWLKYLVLYLIYYSSILSFAVICGILFSIIDLIGTKVSLILGFVLNSTLLAGIITILIFYILALINIKANVYKT